MCETIEQCCVHFGIAKDAGPFTEAQVGGDDDAGAFIQFAQKMEEQRAARGAERQISQLIYYLAGACKACCREGSITKSVLTNASAIFPALPSAFSCSSALTSSTVEKKRTRLR